MKHHNTPSASTYIEKLKQFKFITLADRRKIHPAMFITKILKQEIETEWFR